MKSEMRPKSNDDDNHTPVDGIKRSIKGLAGASLVAEIPGTINTRLIVPWYMWVAMALLLIVETAHGVFLIGRMYGHFSLIATPGAAPVKGCPSNDTNS